jgi:hypothetical protein
VDHRAQSARSGLQARHQHELRPVSRPLRHREYGESGHTRHRQVEAQAAALPRDPEFIAQNAKKPARAFQVPAGVVYALLKRRYVNKVADRGLAMSTEPNGVRIERIDGRWIVFIVIKGETTQQTFEAKEYAESFAAGQRARLEMIEAKEANETKTSRSR